MSAIPKQVSIHSDNADATSSDNEAFLKLLPAVKTHAQIQFRHLGVVDRDEAIAEATASAFLNFKTAKRRGQSHRITPSTLAHYAILHVKDGRHVGGGSESKCDVFSRKAQRRFGFKVVGLPWDSDHTYDCMNDPTSPVWKQVLLDDKSTPVPDQAAFRIDWSGFLGQQSDRTRKIISMLAEGHKQTEVADRLGVTPPAVCQRVRKAEREWDVMQDEV